jgi:uronate dehydrogenase
MRMNTGQKRPPETAPVILITGAAGRIGSMLRRALIDDPALAAHYGQPARLLVTDIVDPGPGTGSDTAVVGDLADATFVDTLFADRAITAIIHLAGHPREAEWDVLLDANIRSSIHLWETARKHAVDRVLFASSNHAVGFYPRSWTIDHTVPQRPDTRYGLTKVFGEELGFLYAYKFGIRAFSMRIGTFTPEPTSYRGLSSWISQRDMAALVRIGLIADYTCETVYGVSNNSRTFWDNSAAERLGYHPQDSADDFAHLFPEPAKVEGDHGEHFQGGPFAMDGLTSSAGQLAELDEPELQTPTGASSAA